MQVRADQTVFVCWFTVMVLVLVLSLNVLVLSLTVLLPSLHLTTKRVADARDLWKQAFDTIETRLSQIQVFDTVETRLSPMSDVT